MRYLHEERAPTRIAEATGLQRTNLSTVLRGLERKNLSERDFNDRDRRGVVVQLTERRLRNYIVARTE